MVSVIIPTFNRKSVLARALDSVLRQTWTELELIVIDDGSTDGTEEFVREWRESADPERTLTYLKTENRGVSHARNRGAELARGEWVAFLDSDDEWLEDKLERQMALAQSYTVIHGQEIWMRGGVRVNPPRRYEKSGGRIFERCADVCAVAASSLLIKKAVFENFREDFPVCEDFELWLRLSSKYEFGFVAEPVLIRHGGSGDQLSLKFKAMDYFRVKALLPFLDDPALSEAERRAVAESIVTKGQILMGGFVKHGNMENFKEVEEAVNRAQFPGNA